MTGKMHCNFCGKSQDDVFRLIAAADAAICDGCALAAANITKAEHSTDARGVDCPGCGQRISMMAAAGKDQRWGLTLSPGPSGLLQAATVAGAIDGAQKLMRFSCREDGVNVQTYLASASTCDEGKIELRFVTMPVSKAWARANGRKPASGIEAASAGETAETGSTEGESPVAKPDAQKPQADQ